MQVETHSEQASSILNLMKESRIYWQVKREVIGTLLKQGRTQIHTSDIAKLIRTANHGDKLQGLISNCIQKSTRRLPIELDQNALIEGQRSKWSELLIKDFNNMACKVLREEEYDEEDQSVNYIYDCSSLLHFLASIGHGHPAVRPSEALMFPPGLLPVANYPQLRSKYSFLLQGENLIGGQGEGEAKEREKKARRIVEGEQIASDIEDFLSWGCANGERVSVYRRYFQCFYEYSGKRVEWGLYSKMWGSIVRSDAKVILRDPVYFVFKECLLRMYQTFVCDKQIGQMVRVRQTSPNHTPLHHLAPIHGILPCRSFTHYMAPFCYTSSNVEEVYQLWRYVYANYFVLLNTISSLPDSILSLCLLFEKILWETEKEIVGALESLHIQPVQLVFPWLFYCFIGYIPTEQFFLMLDRIIALKSLDILPLYAVSLLHKEKQAILGASSLNALQIHLSEALEEDLWIETVRQYLKAHH